MISLVHTYHVKAISAKLRERSEECSPRPISAQEHENGLYPVPSPALFLIATQLEASGFML